jgi:MFS family permease
MGFLVSASFTPFLGGWMDRHGPRLVIPAGVIAMSAGLALAPFVSRPWHLYLTLGVLVSCGSVVVGYTGHSFFLPNWFVRRRGIALGLAFSGVGVGAIALFPWLQAMILGAGWRTACWAMAGVLLVLVPLNALFQRLRPEEIGLAPDGDQRRPMAGDARHASNVVDPAWVAVEWTLARAIRTSRFWWVFGAFFTSLFAWYAVQVHQTKYLIEVGYAPVAAAYALGFVGLAGVGGQIGLGYLSDRIGREWVWTIACVGYVSCYGILDHARAPDARAAVRDGRRAGPDRPRHVVRVRRDSGRAVPRQALRLGVGRGAAEGEPSGYGNEWLAERACSAC